MLLLLLLESKSDCMYRSTWMAFTALVCVVVLLLGDVLGLLHFSLRAIFHSFPLIHVDDSLDEDYFDIML